MKKILFVALTALVSSPAFAFAPPTGCHDGRDHGYTVEFRNGMAEVSLTTFADTKVIANLTCRRVNSDAVVLSCYEPNLRDAGYSLVMRAPKEMGVYPATLKEVTFAGSEPVAELECR
jgi:hypothetical protein